MNRWAISESSLRDSVEFLNRLKVGADRDLSVRKVFDERLSASIKVHRTWNSRKSLRLQELSRHTNLKTRLRNSILDR